MPLHVLGINHHSAPLEVREKLAFPPETQADVIGQSCPTMLMKSA